MLNLFLLLIAATVQAAGPGPEGPAGLGTAAIAVPSGMPTAPAVSGEAAAPAFLAPPAEPAAQAATAAPVFLAPATTAAPAFLAPATPALQAEPQTPGGRFTTATEVRPILAATRSNWIHVRDFNGQDLLYVTHLWSWRCGLLELRVGVNGAAPEVWPLPECHLDEAAPNAILENDGAPYRSYPPGSVAMVEVSLTYDDLTTETLRFDRKGMILP
jgi:hypothetical protein